MIDRRPIEPMEPLTWQVDGACRSHDPQLWFPEHGVNPAAAKAICAACPVRQECLDHAMKVGERFGIWGGLSTKQRARLRSGQPDPRMGRPPRGARSASRSKATPMGMERIRARDRSRGRAEAEVARRHPEEVAAERAGRARVDLWQIHRAVARRHPLEFEEAYARHLASEPSYAEVA